MIHKPIEKIEKVDIDQLIISVIREGRAIEYKRDLSLSNADEKRKVLAAISSFANAGGGDVLYGVTADAGVPKDAAGIPIADKDQLELQLTNLVRDGIEPRIIGIKTKIIDGFPNGHVVLIRVPRSWNGPHVVALGDLSKFYTRTGAGKHQMDWGEIRSAFAASAELPERINRFRMERLAKIVAGETLSWNLDGQGRLVIHLLPLASFTPGFQIEFSKATQQPNLLRPSAKGGGGLSYLFNIDGVIAYDGSGRGNEKVSFSYAHLFRTGCMEIVEGLYGFGQLKISLEAVENTIVRELQRNFEILKNMNVPWPAVVAVSLVGVRGAVPDMGFSFRPPDEPVDRNELLLPDITLEDNTGDPNEYLRPVFNTLANAFGFRRSNRYDETGKVRAP